jgi:hypothetical protein
MVMAATFRARGWWGSSSPTKRAGIPDRPNASRISPRWARVLMSTATSPKSTST